MKNRNLMHCKRESAKSNILLELRKERALLEQEYGRLEKIQSEVDCSLAGLIQEIVELEFELVRRLDHEVENKRLRKTEKNKLKIIIMELAFEFMSRYGDCRFDSFIDKYEEPLFSEEHENEYTEEVEFDEDYEEEKFEEYEKEKIEYERKVIKELVRTRDDSIQREMKSLYRSLAKKIHPDINSGPGNWKEYNELMQQLNEAIEHEQIEKIIEIESRISSGTELESLKSPILIKKVEEEINTLRERRKNLSIDPCYSFLFKFFYAKKEKTVKIKIENYRNFLSLKIKEKRLKLENLSNDLFLKEFLRERYKILNRYIGYWE